MKKNQNITLLPEVAPGSGIAGAVYEAANAARFDSAFHNEALSEFSVGGWDQDPLQELLEFYSPAVSVPERFNYKAGRLADAFHRLEGDDDIRAMGGSFGRLDTERLDDVNEQLDEKGLTIVVDKRDIEADPDAEEKATTRIRRILLRTEIRRAIALLSAAATNTNKTWGSSADPDQDVFADLLVAENAVGVRPNRVGYGSSAWSKRRLAFRAQDTAGARASASMTPTELAQDLMVEAASLAETRYQTASGLSAQVGALVLMFQAMSGLSKDDPSNIKRFTAPTAGASIAVFRQEFARTVEITLAHKSKQKITFTGGIRQQTIS